MRAALAFVAGVIGAGLMIRGVVDWGCAFLAGAAALAAWRALWTARTPLSRVEIALVALCGVAAIFHPVDAALAALVGFAALELMRIM